MRQLLEIALGKEGYRLTLAESGRKATEIFDKSSFDLVISDIKMPDMSGVEVLRHIKETDPSVPVIMVTAYASAETAVEALRLGAYDYLTKPFKLEELKANIRNALEKVRLKRENETLKRELKKTQGLDSMLGGSRVMLELFEHIKSVAIDQQHRPHHRRERDGKGARGEGDSREEPPGRGSPSFPSTAAPSPRPFSRASSSAT